MSRKLVFLKTDQDFAQFRQSKLFSSRNLRLRVRYNTNQNTPRFGFIIPKKVLIKVTDRNKLKRRIKSVLQKYVLNVRGSDFLFLPAKSALKVKFPELEAEILNLLQNSKSWKQ